MTLPLLARSGCRRQLATQTSLRSLQAALCLLALVTLPAHAQDPGTLNPQPLPPLPNSRRAENATAVLRVLSHFRSAARPGK